MKTTRAVLPLSMWLVSVGEAVSAYPASEYHLPERLEGEGGKDRTLRYCFPHTLTAATCLILLVALPALVQHVHLLQALHNVPGEDGRTLVGHRSQDQG